MEDLKYLTEAFQDLNILNEDTFDINADGLAELTSFYNDNDIADLETVIDPVAQTEEELQDSYIGKAILDCVICQSKIYKDPEEVIISEDGSLANVGEICPYCQSSDGYKVIGQVAEYCPHCDDEDVKVEADETEITVDVDKKEDEELEESTSTIDELNDELNKVMREFVAEVNDDEQEYDWQDLEGIQNAYFDKIEKVIFSTTAKVSLQSIEKVVNAVRDEMKSIMNKYPEYSEYQNRNYFGTVTEAMLEDAQYDMDIEDADDKKEKAKDIEQKENDDADADRDEKKKDLKEDMQNISIETDKEKINISSESKEEEEVESDDEMIAPLEPETEEEFKSENEEDEYSDVDIDEFEEKDFDELGEKYLRRVYENVKSYKTTKGSTQGNKLKLEGLITFKSGKEAKTNFVFEAKSITKTGKLKFLGENKQFARGKQAFTLTGRADGKKLIAESLTYNYRAKNPETKESKRLYGTVSSSKLR